MPNVTISVSDELKNEMDKLPEVSWSEICRKAISQYISERKNPAPRIELSLDRTGLQYEHSQTGYPTLSIHLKMHNKMDSEITIDRIIVTARAWKDSQVFPIGTGYDLHKKSINANSTDYADIWLILFNEKIASLAGVFTSTFHCEIHCVVYAEGFKNRYEQNLTTRIPIDDWNEVMKKALEKRGSNYSSRSVKAR